MGDLKGLIEAKHSHKKDWQVIIFSGDILQDSRTMESIKMSEKDFLVLMVKKVRREYISVL